MKKTMEEQKEKIARRRKLWRQAKRQAQQRKGREDIAQYAGLIPHILLPIQAVERECAPVTALNCAILEIAIMDLKGNAPGGNGTFLQHWRSDRQKEAIQWFLSDAVDYPFFFVPLCLRLDLDVNMVRHQLDPWLAPASV